MTKTVAEFMTPTPITVTPATSLREAIQLLAEKQISGLPVVDEGGKLVGVLADTDLMWQETGADPPPYVMFLDSVIFLQNPARYEQELHKSLGQTVGEVMTHKPITIRPEQNLREAAKVMHEKHIRRLPVVNAAGQVVGIISHSDIIRAMAASEGFS
ncbi:CBS domain-containing protein [Spirulina sp. CCNP1310]|uniref:CBS domain-containing protein n=1 Tax=Spirulina sp. CCNP1310 TaxID=3110249 RepID=UPI002B21ABCF|nr:CBS domain-containing protein [Spirulina sp. CCNP1310]MEA5418811.1 CBS domain-containing protein [Spirulina sp. CCNP1310]